MAYKSRKKIKCAAVGTRRNLCKTRPSTPLFPKIEGEIQGQRKAGWRVLAKWFKKNARKLAFESYIDTLKASNGWFFRSLTRNRLARRKRKKKHSKKAFAQRELMKTQLQQKLSYTN